ncbi:MAG: nucleotidyltransferase domain-containing protein [Defluviitaleaceae bacterium]|nr:nucleotidyltransferase domain-containing protein [Defluviitaleaceae bacterium]
MYLFKDKYNLGKPYIYIHPYKQKIVNDIVARAFSEISQLIVFGSAVSLACKPHSDVDVCVIGDFCESKLRELRVTGEALDFVHYTDVDSLRKDRRLCAEVKKGVLVYG